MGHKSANIRLGNKKDQELLSVVMEQEMNVEVD